MKKYKHQELIGYFCLMFDVVAGVLVSFSHLNRPLINKQPVNIAKFFFLDKYFGS